jgi:cytochrome bd-type quinol oxidase subunit 2
VNDKSDIMNYRTHPYVAYAALGVALGCLISVLGVTWLAMSTTSVESLVIFGTWAIALFWVAVIAGVVAAHAWPTYAERRQRLSHAMRWRRGPRTPNHP